MSELQKQIGDDQQLTIQQIREQFAAAGIDPTIRKAVIHNHFRETGRVCVKLEQVVMMRVGGQFEHRISIVEHDGVKAAPNACFAL